MGTFNIPYKVLFVATYPPKKCGIASFTSDLTDAIRLELKNDIDISICALDKKQQAFQYDQQVSMVLDSTSLDACMEAATRINQDTSVNLVCIEHEFGLYGGEMGDYLLGMLSLIEKPFVIRFHTVLPHPDSKRLKVIQAISLIAEKVIVMTAHSALLLRDDYAIASEKIMIIPHGTHEINTVSGVELKKKYDLNTNLVLTTFGLLSPNKGVETGIKAMVEIVKVFPEALYLVIGQTHPNLLAAGGEEYRESLQQLINENALTNNVKLINEFVPTPRLMEYLTLTDIYLFTSRDPDQAVSGTFIYAMSAGCPIISNAFVLAHEMLDEETGIIIPLGDANILAEKAIYLLQHKELREKMGQQAFLKTRNTLWKTVARKHAKLFSHILNMPLPIFHKQPDNAKTV